ncbi:hypothetical protein BJ875DRAFT_453718 [Amylocarpus encephaloides]|uniref:Uncharacterized protein n=1 Tax=Amylocarpus encephaloides TaxID=45428 RepID=A0A9P8C8J8_9HELO|nr:hypothetical protein BJ875DRAFT_453718 [Amylocarpus encephaloides]
MCCIALQLQFGPITLYKAFLLLISMKKVNIPLGKHPRCPVVDMVSNILGLCVFILAFLFFSFRHWFALFPCLNISPRLLDYACSSTLPTSQAPDRDLFGYT